MTENETLQTAIRSRWPNPSTGKALSYVGRFFDRTRGGKGKQANPKAAGLQMEFALEE